MSAPMQFEAYGFNLIIGTPKAFAPFSLSDEALDSARAHHVRRFDDRRIDVQLISPRPFAMLHWERPRVVEHWTRATNDVIAQSCRLYPDRFRGVAQLPQQGDQDTGNCIAELDRCIGGLGFVGAIVNPDPAGDRTVPKLDAEYRYPLYRRAQELHATLVVPVIDSIDFLTPADKHAIFHDNPRRLFPLMSVD